MVASDFWMKQISFIGFSGKISLGLTVFAELVCSILLILGLFTRISLFFLAFCMSWIFLVVFPISILDKGDNGYQFNDAFVYFMIYLGLFFTGPRNYSLDAKLFGKS